MGSKFTRCISLFYIHFMVTNKREYMSPIALFFAFGIFAGVLKSDLKLPSTINDFIGYFLLFSIGLKGGVELEGQPILYLIPQFVAVAMMGFVLPLVAYPFLKKMGRLKKVDAASLAAHYGSVSVGTFAVCVAFLNRQNVSFEPYAPIYVVILEVPAIIVGLLLAKGLSNRVSMRSTMMECLTSKAVVLLVGGLFIGALSGKKELAPFTTFYFDMFYGFLALFLIDMGLSVSEKLKEVQKYGAFLIAFGLIMPLVGAMLAMGLGVFMNMSLGGVVVLATLGASSSYIAVPAAYKISLPEANLGLSMGSSLGVTFPFNIFFGIPLYYYIATTWFFY